MRPSHFVLGVAVLLVVIGVRLHHRNVPVDNDMQAAIRERLLREYSGRRPAELARLLPGAHPGSPIEPGPDIVQRDVQFVSMRAHAKTDHFKLHSTTTWIRAEIMVDGRAPPDGQEVRYFLMYQSATVGASSTLAASDAAVYYWTLVF